MIRQAITTKYIGPTNFRGSRVAARAQAGRVVLSWDDSLGVNENHERAARVLADRYGWLEPRTYDGTTHAVRMVGGALPGGEGNAYVLIDD